MSAYDPNQSSTPPSPEGFPPPGAPQPSFPPPGAAAPPPPSPPGGWPAPAATVPQPPPQPPPQPWSGEFGAGGVPPSGGYPPPSGGYGAPPPRKRGLLPVVLGVVAALVILGGVVFVV